MYSYIKGILTDMDEESIVVETGGIGYHIYTTGQTFRYLPSVGEEVKVHGSEEEIRKCLEQAIRGKPKMHHFEEQNFITEQKNMSQIGG